MIIKVFGLKKDEIERMKVRRKNDQKLGISN